MNRRIGFFLIFIILCGLFTGCRDESDGSGYIFKYDVPDNPRTLDPQNASGRTAALLIANMFDGLLKVDGDGNIVGNMAVRYSVCSDMLIYTFILREDVYWYFGGESEILCTARDFVFGFRRLFNPAVKSVNAPLFYNIKNAEKVHKGEISELDAVGVEARGDFELVITLEEPDPLFIHLLTTPPAMPCNEEIFNKTAGRYGLNAANIPSNGAFYITQWYFDAYRRDDNMIAMRRNTKNNRPDSDERIYPFGLNFFIGRDEDPFLNFQINVTQAFTAEGSAAEFLISQGFPYDSFENITWGVYFNTSRGRVFRNEDLRFALAASINREEISISRNGWRTAKSILPPLVDKGVGNDIISYNPEEARAAFETGAKAAGHGNLTDVNIIMSESEVAEEYLRRILQQWQAILGFYCTIKALPFHEYERAIAENDYDIAFMRLTGGFNHPDAYLSRIVEENFIPICYQTEMFFYNPRSRDLLYNPFTGVICFKSAKYF